jgi:hypothetical protein
MRKHLFYNPRAGFHVWLYSFPHSDKTNHDIECSVLRRFMDRGPLNFESTSDNLISEMYREYPDFPVVYKR